MNHSSLFRFFALASVCASAISAAPAASVSTDPVSVLTYSVPGLSDHQIGIPLMRPPVYEGRVTAVDAANNTITLEGSPEWVVNAFTSAQSHFVHFKSGAEEGMWLDIVSNTADTLTVLLRPGDTLDTITGGEVVAIVPHWTPKTFFGDTAREATLLHLYRTYVSGVNLAPSNIFYFWEGDWYDLTDNVIATDAALRPNEGMTIRTPDALPYTWTIKGVVPMATQRIAFRTKSASKAEDQRFGLSIATPIQIKDMAIPATEGDVILCYFNGTGMTIAPNRMMYYYQGRWYDLVDGTEDTDSFEMRPDFGFVYRKEATAKPETVIWQYTPNYLK